MLTLSAHRDVLEPVALEPALEQSDVAPQLGFHRRLGQLLEPRYRRDRIGALRVPSQFASVVKALGTDCRRRQPLLKIVNVHVLPYR